MKKSEIVVGGRYEARVSGNYVVVRVLSINDRPKTSYSKAATTFRVVNETTKRETTFRSAAKFRRPADEPKQSKPRNAEEHRAALLADPLAKDLAPDEPEHAPGEDGFVASTIHQDRCRCRRCQVIRARIADTAPKLTDLPPEVLKSASEIIQVIGTAARSGDEQSLPPTTTMVGTSPQTKSTGGGKTTGSSTTAARPAATTDDGYEAAQQAWEAGYSSDNPPPKSSSLSDRLRQADRRFEPGKTVAGYTPTEEQAEILKAGVRDGLRCLKVKAGAGTGKTSTLKMLEEVLVGQGQYTAFNSKLVAGSRGKFRKARCNTTHSLAFGSVGRLYAHRLGGQRVRSEQVARMLGLGDMTLEIPDPDAKPAEGETGPVMKKRVLPAGALAGFIRRAVDKFCQSADRTIKREHFRYIPGIDATTENGRRGHENNDKVKAHLLPFAAAMWKDLKDPNGKMPFVHDNYVKVWQLGEGKDAPIINADYILLDEAQDTAPVVLDVLERQSALIILVGDDNQQIYEWRGAVNAMAAFEGAPRCLLSQSFRFGQSIADVANSVLAGLDEPTELVMKGLESIPSRVLLPALRQASAPAGGQAEDGGDPHSTSDCDAVLCRTNACAVGTVLAAVGAGKKPHLVGGGAEVVKFVKAARDLQEGRGTGHPELCCFESWLEVQEYVKTEDGEDLKLMVKLIDEFKVEPILNALEHMPAEEDADLVVSTAHKSKGLEWSRVKLAGDFPPANRMGDSDRRLLYVALTRAQHLLDLRSCTPFMIVTDQQTKEPVRPIPITFTRKMPTETELGAWLAKRAEQKPVTHQPYHKTGEQPRTYSDEVQSDAATPTPAANGDGRPQFTWSNFNGEWLVRGPAGQSGQRVEVTRKNGTTSTERLGEAVQSFPGGKHFPDAVLYRIKK